MDDDGFAHKYTVAREDGGTDHCRECQMPNVRMHYYVIEVDRRVGKLVLRGDTASELKRSAKIMTRRATGQPLPDDLVGAIGKSDDASGDVGGWRVLVKNDGNKFDKRPAVELVPPE